MLSYDGWKLGKYRIDKIICRSHMSEVYLGYDTSDNREVAIKIVHSDSATSSNKDLSRRFQEEARIVRKLNHPHILRLDDYGEERSSYGDFAYIVMPYLPEGSLARWIEKNYTTRVLLPQEVEHFVRQAAEALQYAHEQNVIHRDVKPSNFLINKTSAFLPLPYLLLADFGIAKITASTNTIAADTPDKTRTVNGTPIYMPPEQWMGSPVAASDQYALAIMIYELLTGGPPFVGDLYNLMHAHHHNKPQVPSSRNSALNSDIDKVLLRALEKDHRNRFASIWAFAEAFKQAIHTTPSPSPVAQIQPDPDPEEAGNNNITPSITDTYTLDAKNSPRVTSPGPTGNTPSGTKKPKNFYIAIALVALALLVISSSAIWAVNSLFITPGILDATATAKASTAIARNATNTTIAQINAVSEQKTATTIAKYPDPYPPKGSLDLYDPLDGKNEDSSWYQGKTIPCIFQDGSYLTSDLKDKPTFPCLNRTKSYTNFALQVNMKMIKGDCGDIIFGDNPLKDTYYVFSVCPANQSYSVIKYDGHNFNQILNPQEDSSDLNSNLCNSDGSCATITIAIVVIDLGITPFINNNQLTRVDDNTYPGGKIGLAADSFITNGNNTKAIFSDLFVWKI